ncbi:hypothetical protein [Frateuria sp. Soil773]|uniref:hypothetical protein n=1 Tax=Frateuria sp. Soil773 TaxID=1736407 RepID=UPI0012FC4900|nr:hypothetical protein [Frateuria sp. Soil773]
MTMTMTMTKTLTQHRRAAAQTYLEGLAAFEKNIGNNPRSSMTPTLRRSITKRPRSWAC